MHVRRREQVASVFLTQMHVRPRVVRRDRQSLTAMRVRKTGTLGGQHGRNQQDGQKS